MRPAVRAELLHVIGDDGDAAALQAAEEVAVWDQAHALIPHLVAEARIVAIDFRAIRAAHGAMAGHPPSLPFPRSAAEEGGRDSETARCRAPWGEVALDVLARCAGKLTAHTCAAGRAGGREQAFGALQSPQRRGHCECTEKTEHRGLCAHAQYAGAPASRNFLVNLG